MAEASTNLTTPLDVSISEQQLTSLLGQEPNVLPRLLIVQKIEEDENSVTIRFEQGSRGCLARDDRNEASYLRLAQRSQARQHPIGVKFGEESTILEVLRADNDIPAELWQEESGHVRVLFQGHDGVYHLQSDHPEFARIRTLLDEAIRQQTRVWFIAQKSDLTLLDVLPAGWTVEEFHISFVVAPDHLLKIAEEILHSKIPGTKALRRDIQAVAKTYIDEADELKRAIREIQTNAARIQIGSRSPPDMIEKAKNLQTVRFPNKELEEKVRAVASSYVRIAEENQQLFDEFKAKYRDKLPPAK